MCLFWGSSRFKENHSYYKFTKRKAYEYAKLGFAVMTGDDPGLMKAANRRPREVGRKSVGCIVELPID